MVFGELSQEYEILKFKNPSKYVYTISFTIIGVNRLQNPDKSIEFLLTAEYAHK